MEPICNDGLLTRILDAHKRKRAENVLKHLVFDETAVRRMISVFEEQISFATSPDEATRKKTDLFWENTFVRRLPTGKENGVFLGMDLGGTSFRIVKVDMTHGKGETVTKYYKLDPALLTGPCSGIFDHIATSLQSFVKEENLRNDTDHLLGFTFSFPSVQTSLKHSVISTWTKSIKCPDGPGLDAVNLLEDAIKRKGGIPVPVEVVARISDTTGTLMAGSFEDPECRIGLIIGTGSNAAFVEHVENIARWNTFKDDDDSDLVVINTEFGALGDNGCMDFMRTEFDKEVDKNSNHVGSYTFEKSYSGLYLGELIRIVLLKLVKEGVLFAGKGSDRLSKPWHFTTSHVTSIERDIDNTCPNTRAILEEMGLLDLASEEDISFVRDICALVSKRGAYIVATAMVVLLKHINRPEVTIAVDGSLYEHHPKYHDHMMDLMKRFAPETKVKMILVKDGSGKGGALVAAVESQKRKLKSTVPTVNHFSSL